MRTIYNDRSFLRGSLQWQNPIVESSEEGAGASLKQHEAKMQVVCEKQATNTHHEGLMICLLECGYFDRENPRVGS